MNELIPVTQNNDGTIAVSGRSVHEFLGITTEYKKWLLRMAEYGFEESVDFHKVTQKCHTSKTGQSITDHVLTLDMAKELCMIQRNEKGKEARRYFIEVEKRYKRLPNISELSPQLQLLINMEQRQKELESQISATNYKVDSIKEVVALNVVDGRKKVTTILNKIAVILGGGSSFQDIRNESYKRLEYRANCSLGIRQTNKRKKMALEGANKSRINAVTKLDVIFDDSRLTEIYFAIVKEMAIQHQIDVNELVA